MSNRIPLSPQVLIILALALLILVLPTASQAEDTYVIEVSPTGLARIPLALPTVTTDSSLSESFVEEFRQTLMEDFSFTGILHIIPRQAYLADPEKKDVDYEDWLFIGAEYLIRVHLSSTGDNLRAQVAIYDIALRRKQSSQTLQLPFDSYVLLAHQVAGHILYEVSGIEGFFDAQIAYTSDYGSQAGGAIKNIYTMDFDGSQRRNITRNDSININPFWHDNDKIAFTSYIRQRPEILLRELDTGRTALLAAFGGTNTGGVKSPDGKYIAVTASRNGISNIYLLHSDGRMYRQLTHHWSIDVTPAWSPDGRYIAFVSDRPGSPQIYKIELATDQITRITYDGRYNVSPAWSPDGSEIAYVSLEDNKFNIYIVQNDGYNPRRLTYNSGHNETPRWSRDGNYLLFNSNRSGEHKLYIMDRSGAFQKRLNDGPGNNTMPDWIFPKSQ
ncbi:DPP IV N-terminal domain-containing protein [Desulfurispira natronophila]|uniref:TolB protein n=1 Tax=Desulfurispira natronophila TaxID=682562 RepID=A0A7W7Y5P3_9BACT|nr:DPP IV N-terminal domain-containing protein [Desulfurispira natronophila]MBB5022570.1 TolB protein [Desulfurispira natronophila]